MEKHCLLGRGNLTRCRIDVRVRMWNRCVYVCLCMYVRDMQVQTEQSHVKLVAIGVLQTRGASHLGADHGDTHGRGRRRGQQARLHPCKWCTARTVLPKSFIVLSTKLYLHKLKHAYVCGIKHVHISLYEQNFQEVLRKPSCNQPI